MASLGRTKLDSSAASLRQSRTVMRLSLGPARYTVNVERRRIDSSATSFTSIKDSSAFAVAKQVETKTRKPGLAIAVLRRNEWD